MIVSHETKLQAEVLWHLEHRVSLQTAVLADKCGVGTPRMLRILKKLEKQRMVWGTQPWYGGSWHWRLDLDGRTWLKEYRAQQGPLPQEVV